MFRRREDEKVSSESQNPASEGLNFQPLTLAFANSEAVPTFVFTPKTTATDSDAFSFSPSAELPPINPRPSVKWEQKG